MSRISTVRRRDWVTRAIACALIIGPGAEVNAQGLIGLGSGARIGFSFTGIRASSEDRPALSDNAYLEWLRLPIEGMLIDPRIFRYRFAVDLRLSQQAARTLPEGLRGRSLGWSGNAQLFSSQPVSIAVSARRASGSTGRGDVSMSEFSSNSVTGSLRYRNPYLPVTLIHSQRSSENTWQAGPDLSIDRRSWSRTTQLRASNRKLSILLARDLSQAAEATDRISGSQVLVNHSVGWGKGSRLTTTVERLTQEGLLNTKRSRWMENLRIQHTEDVYSTVSFRRASSLVSDQKGRTWSLNGQINGQITDAARVGFGARRSVSSFGIFTESATALGPTLSTRVTLPAELRLTASGSLRRERRVRVGEGGVVPVIDESHVVDETRVFFLDQPDVDLASIHIRSTNQARFDLETDFRFSQLGDLTQVIVPAGSRIRVGDELLISYMYVFEGVPSATSYTGGYSVAVSRSGISLTHSLSFRDGTDAQSGGVQVRQHYEKRTSIRAVRFTSVGRLDLGATYRDRDSEEFRYETLGVEAALVLPRWSTRTAILGASYSTSASDGRHASTLSLRSNFGWQVSSRMRLGLRVERLSLTTLEQGTDVSTSADLEAHATVGATSVDARLVRSMRGGVRSITRHHFSVRLVRHF